MVNHDDIPSTQKLADVIRADKSFSKTTKSKTSQAIGEYSSIKSSEKQISSKKKAANVGVVISEDHIILGMINRSSKQKLELLDCTKVKFAKGLFVEDPEFPKFLQKCLTDFCKRGKKN